MSFHSTLQSIFGTGTLQIIDFVRKAYLCKFAWVRLQVLWCIASTVEKTALAKPMVPPLQSPRDDARPGTRRDEHVMRAAVLRRHRKPDRKGRVRLHPAAHMQRNAGAFTRAERVYLSRYLLQARAKLKSATSVHISADSSRKGGKNTEFVCVYSGTVGAGAWAPPQDTTSPISKHECLLPEPFLQGFGFWSTSATKGGFQGSDSGLGFRV